MAAVMDNLPRFLDVKQAAEYLNLNEKKIYALVSEGRIPGTKVTGKWIFPRELIDRWMLESSRGPRPVSRIHRLPRQAGNRGHRRIARWLRPHQQRKIGLGAGTGGPECPDREATVR